MLAKEENVYKFILKRNLKKKHQNNKEKTLQAHYKIIYIYIYIYAFRQQRKTEFISLMVKMY